MQQKVSLKLHAVRGFNHQTTQWHKRQIGIVGFGYSKNDFQKVCFEYFEPLLSNLRFKKVQFLLLKLAIKGIKNLHFYADSKNVNIYIKKT